MDRFLNTKTLWMGTRCAVYTYLKENGLILVSQWQFKSIIFAKRSDFVFYHYQAYMGIWTRYLVNEDCLHFESAENIHIFFVHIMRFKLSFTSKLWFWLLLLEVLVLLFLCHLILMKIIIPEQSFRKISGSNNFRPANRIRKRNILHPMHLQWTLPSLKPQ